MTKEETLEYNKRCAEFLGYVNTTLTDKDFDIYLNEKGMIIGNKIHTIIEPMSAKFHSDWNWIMEVVGAIEKLQYFFIHAPFLDDETQELSGEYFCIIQHKTTNINQPYFIDVVGCSSKKEAVVKAIDQFLIWYKNQ